MKKFLLTFAVLPLFIAGCGSGDKDGTVAETTGGTTSGSTGSTPAPKEPKDQLVGTWKVDITASSIPGLSEGDRKEFESVRVTVASDGMYTAKTVKDESKGKWTIDGKKVKFTPDDHNQADPPPEMTLSDDGAQLKAEMKQGDQTASLVMVKE